jgi:hypothetical protein
VIKKQIRSKDGERERERERERQSKKDWKNKVKRLLYAKKRRGRREREGKYAGQ